MKNLVFGFSSIHFKVQYDIIDIKTFWSINTLAFIPEQLRNWIEKKSLNFLKKTLIFQGHDGT